MRWATLWEAKWILLIVLLVTVPPALWQPLASAPGLLILGFVLWFFRDPERKPPEDASCLVAPADGVVTAVEKIKEAPHGGPAWRISIFLSIFDVHVNRSPADSTVLRRDFQPGRFLDARHPDSASINQMMTWILEDNEGRRITVRQITGAIARRIVAWVSVGEKVAQGSRLGMIRFGSRTDLFLPLTAEPCVTTGQRVRGALTIVARWKNSG